MSIETDISIIEQALIDHMPGPLPEHDPLCRTFSGWPDQEALGCNCSVARNEKARHALARIRVILRDNA